MIDVITEYKSGNAIVGGKIFISTEDAKAILRETATMPPLPAGEDEAMYVQEATNRLHNANAILRQFAKAILYSPVNPDITLASIASKYL